MKYTYKFELGSDNRYLKFSFDRQLFGDYFSRGWQYDTIMTAAERPSPKILDLLNSVYQTNGVLRNEHPTHSISGELIVVEGSNLTVKVANFDNIPELAKQIVKKVQRRIAPNESRRLVKLTALRSYAAKLNAKHGV